MSTGPSLVAAHVVWDVMMTSRSGFSLKAGLKTQLSFLSTVLAFYGMARTSSEITPKSFCFLEIRRSLPGGNRGSSGALFPQGCVRIDPLGPEPSGG